MATLDYKKVISELLNDFGISQDMMASLIDASAASVSRWLKGKSSPQKVYQERILELQYVDEELKKSLKEEYIPRWLDTPIDYLGGDRPIDALKKGKHDKVLQLLAYLEGDVYL
ncbi:MAG: helix-turn-helix transcriptional regulator [Actinomycetota bacterium]|nr:helix-turn-helix transcriptional regulator [Actinomycetota bacterium]